MKNSADIKVINLIDYIDFNKINVLLEGFNKTTGFVTAILDLKGNVLSKSGWRQICTDFHRINSQSLKKCVISDTVLAGEMAKGERYHVYKCLNGLVDVAVPIIVKGEHIANLFTGQFFFEKPDAEFFIKQAEKYNYDQPEYIDALQKVPIVSEEKVKNALNFLLDVTLIISEMTLQKLEQNELSSMLETREKRFSTIINQAGDAMYLCSLDGEIKMVNKYSCEMLAYSENELLKMKLDDLDIGYINKKEQKNILEKIEDNIPQTHITKHKRKDGFIIPVEIRFSIIEFDGANSILAFVRDIRERQKRDALIHLGETRFSELVNTINSGVAIYKVINDGQTGNDYIIDDFNEYALLHENKTIEEVIGKSLLDIRPNVEEFGLIDVFRKVWTTGEAEFFPAKVYIDENYSNYYENRIFKLPSGEIVAVYDDVTDKKIADKELEKSLSREKILADIVRESSVGIAIGYPDGRIDMSNSAYQKITGYNDEELKTIDWNKVLTPKKWTEFEAEKLKEVLDTKKPVKFEKEYIRKDGSIVPVELMVNPQYNDNGDFEYFFAFVIDITERKKAEEEIKNQVSKWQTTFDAMSDSVCIIDNDGVINQYNEATLLLFNKNDGNLKGKKCYELFHNKKDFFDNCPLIKMKTSKKPESMIFKDRDLWLEVNVDPIFNSENKIIGAVHVVSDITKRKQIEKALEKSEEYFRTLIENSSDVIAILDKQGFIIYESPTHEKVLGYPPNKLIGENVFDYLHANDRERIFKQFKKLINKPKGIEYVNFRFLHENGSWIHIEGTGTNMLDSTNINGIVVNYRDVTERKQTEYDLFKSEERFDLAVKGSNDAIWDWDDLESDVYWWSDRLYEILGYKPGEVEARISNWVKWMHPDDSKNVKNILNKHFDEQEPYQVEFRMQKKNGDYIWVSVSGESIRDENGKPIRMAGSLSDITSRKQAEKDLRASTELFKIAFNQQFQFMAVLSPEGRIIEINDLPLTVQGGSREQVLGEYFWEIPTWSNNIELKNKIKNQVLRSSKMNKSLLTEDTFITIEGDYHTALAAYTAIRDEGNKLRYILVQATDITDRKQAEKEVLKYQEQLEKLVKERTRNLEEKNKELERFNELFVDREFRIKELKEQINKLEKL